MNSKAKYIPSLRIILKAALSLVALYIVGVMFIVCWLNYITFEAQNTYKLNWSRAAFMSGESDQLAGYDSAAIP